MKRQAVSLTANIGLESNAACGLLLRSVLSVAVTLVQKSMDIKEASDTEYPVLAALYLLIWLSGPLREERPCSARP